MEPSEIEFGTTLVDQITGFKGVAIGHCTYISGCDQVLLSPAVDEKGGYHDARWFDVQRLKRDHKVRKIGIDNGQTPGCDAPAPIK